MDMKAAFDVLRADGLTPSKAASWENAFTLCATSIETWGPATYGHPKGVVRVNKETGTVTISTPRRNETRKA